MNSRSLSFLIGVGLSASLVACAGTVVRPHAPKNAANHESPVVMVVAPVTLQGRNEIACNDRYCEEVDPLLPRFARLLGNEFTTQLSASGLARNVLAEEDSANSHAQYLAKIVFDDPHASYSHAGMFGALMLSATVVGLCFMGLFTDAATYDLSGHVALYDISQVTPKSLVDSNTHLASLVYDTNEARHVQKIPFEVEVEVSYRALGGAPISDSLDHAKVQRKMAKTVIAQILHETLPALESAMSASEPTKSI